jgi:hypothetical protein
MLVLIPPEYASAKGARKAGRIDFIPIVKWGIEITRDENWLLEHADRLERMVHGWSRKI